MTFMDGFYKNTEIEPSFDDFLLGHIKDGITTVLYAIGRHLENEEPVSYKLCAEKNKNCFCKASVEEIIEAIEKNELILWSIGENDNFNKLSLVGPCKNDKGKKYLKSLNDDTASNNLEKLPIF